MSDAAAEVVRGLAAEPFRPRGTLPLWQQIADRLQAACDDGRLAGDMRLPSENRMAEIFGVTRLTMRRALARLQQEGKLQARKGVGIFVRPIPLRYRLDHGRRFADGLDLPDAQITTETLALESGLATPDEAQALRLAPSDPVIRLRRLRLLDGAPVYVAAKCFPAIRFAYFAKDYAHRKSVRDVYEGHGISCYEVLETRVRGGFATLEEATTLRLTPYTPVLRTAAVNADAEERPIEYNLGTWPLTAVELVVRKHAGT